MVEVLGEQAGWLALQAGIAVCADAVLIPEIPCDLDAVAAKLKDKARPGGLAGWWWWPKGAKFVEDTQAPWRTDAQPAQSFAVAAGHGRGR